MTWQIIINGHSGTDEYGSDAYKETEASLADEAERVAESLKDKGATTVRFAGNFVNREKNLIG